MHSKSKDKITIENLQAHVTIGVSQEERQKKQLLTIDLAFLIDNQRASKSDHIKDTTNYSEVYRTALAFTENSQYHLIETLSEALAGKLLQTFELSWVSIRIYKPQALPKPTSVSLYIERHAH